MTQCCQGYYLLGKDLRQCPCLNQYMTISGIPLPIIESSRDLNDLTSCVFKGGNHEVTMSLRKR